MAKKHDNDYFEMFVELVDYSCRAAHGLYDTLTNFDVAKLPDTMEVLHQIEHAADGGKHNLMEKLTAEFIPPIEREDIIAITNEIDDVTDSIEDVLMKVYMYNIQSIRSEAIEFCQTIVQCCEALKNAMIEFRHFKKTEKLKPLIIEINRLEGEGDRQYTEAVHTLFTGRGDPIEAFAWTQVFSRMERCCDACEHTANVIESVIMKNS